MQSLFIQTCNKDNTGLHKTSLTFGYFNFLYQMKKKAAKSDSNANL